MTEQPVSLVSVVERLAKLEGLLQGLNSTLIQSQAQTAAFMAKVGDLEKRQVELERAMVTSADMQALTEKVDRLITSEARRQGSANQAAFALPVIAQWGALLVALLALVSSTINRQAIQQERIDINPPTYPR